MCWAERLTCGDSSEYAHGENDLGSASPAYSCVRNKYRGVCVAVSGNDGESLMHACAFCKRPLNRNFGWKGRDERLYCSEFCAEDEDLAISEVQLGPHTIPAQHHQR